MPYNDDPQFEIISMRDDEDQVADEQDEQDTAEEQDKSAKEE